MNPAARTIPAHLTPAQWIARLVSLPVFGLALFLMFVLLTDMEDIIPDHIPFTVAISSALICILAAWRWSYWGGMALLITSVVVWLTDRYLIMTSDPQAPFFSLALPSLPNLTFFSLPWPSLLNLTFFATGLLFVLAHRQRR
jgi:hypothetical protein